MILFNTAFVSSFPRRRESNFTLGQLLKKNWVPVCAGMTIAIFALISVSFAQDTLPAIGSAATDQSQPIDAGTIQDTQRILIIGDAMGGGMGAGLIRAIGDDPQYQVVNRFNEASALSRPDRYDWAASIPKIMEGKDFSTAVVLIGLNDRQDIRTETARYTFNTPEWIAAYKANVDAVIDALLAQNVKVIWLGEPPMGDPGYDAEMQIVTSLQKERALAKGITFVDLRAPFLGADGAYTDRGPDDTGVDRRLRESDGVTFFKMGNNRLGQIVLEAIKNRAVVPVPAPVQDSAVPVAEAPALIDDQNGPVFVQEDQNGLAVLHSGEDVVASVATQTATAAAMAASSIGIAAPSGSAAEKMFTVGVSPVAPPGRFDDFSYAAPAP
jgi:uncharacterized protein